MAVAQSRNHEYLKVCLSPDVMARLHWYTRFRAPPGQTFTEVVRSAIVACLADGAFNPPPRRHTKRDEWGSSGGKKPEFDVYISSKHKARVAEMATASNVFQSHVVECMIIHAVLGDVMLQDGQGAVKAAAPQDQNNRA
jgi:hypothetical protein